MHKPLFSSHLSDPELVLRQAAVQGNLAMLSDILQKYPNLNIMASDPGTGLTALHRACIEGHQKVAHYLLMQGADLLAKDNSGKTAHMLCKTSQLVESLPFFYEICNAKKDLLTALSFCWQEHNSDNVKLYPSRAREFFKKITPREKSRSDEETKCVHYTWAWQFIFHSLDLTLELNVRPSSEVVLFTSFVYLTQLIKSHFQNAFTVELLEYLPFPEKTKKFMLVINRDPNGDIFKLHKDPNAIIFDIELNRIYFANEPPPESSVYQKYQASKVRASLISNQLPSMDSLKQSTRERYQRLWSALYEKCLPLLPIDSESKMARKCTR